MLTIKFFPGSKEKRNEVREGAQDWRGGRGKVKGEREERKKRGREK